MNIALHGPQLQRRLSVGPYDRLYAARPDNILWGDNPSRVVQKFLEKSVNDGLVLDAGCGDGANSVALERNGFSVVGLDISSLALRGLMNRFARHKQRCVGTYFNEDVNDFILGQQYFEFDCIVSCGLFHCLANERRVRSHRLLLERFLRPGGTFLFSSLTNEIPLPVDHKTPGIYLPALDEIYKILDGMEIMHSEAGAID